MNQETAIRCIGLSIAMLSLAAAHADEYVDKADANDDGYVSLHELRAAYYADPEFNARIERAFELYDRDGDGLISENERLERRAGISAAETAGSANSASGQTEMAAQSKSRTEGSRRDDAKTARPAAPDSIMSRNEAWVREMDTDNSGGASMRELIASGNGQQWFRESEFEAADINDDGQLNASELALLVQSLERRQR